ncbi:hypothetical protein Tco_1571878 [Tanacetum coccineum]
MLGSCKKSKKMEALKGCLFNDTKGEEGEGYDILSPLKDLHPKAHGVALNDGLGSAKRCGYGFVSNV